MSEGYQPKPQAMHRPPAPRITPASVGGEAQHPDDAAVDRFAAAMKAKLAQKRAEGRSGWEDKEQCGASFLSQLLREHVDKGDPLDVGNLAMMLQQRGDAILAAPQASEAVRNAALEEAAIACESWLMAKTRSDLENMANQTMERMARHIRALKSQADKDGGDCAKGAGDAKAWIALFWSVAKELNCLPSSFVDGNKHVLRAARQARAALNAQTDGGEHA